MKQPSVERLLADGVMTQTRRFTDYGDVGDYLYVKEAYAFVGGRLVYKADWSGEPWDEPSWKSARYLRKENCRIILRITRKWEERILDISQQDAKAVSGSLSEYYKSLSRNFGQDIFKTNPMAIAYEFVVMSVVGEPQ